MGLFNFFKKRKVETFSIVKNGIPMKKNLLQDEALDLFLEVVINDLGDQYILEKEVIYNKETKAIISYSDYTTVTTEDGKNEYYLESEI